MNTAFNSSSSFSRGRASNLSFDQQINILFQFKHLSKETRDVLSQVYSTLAVALSIACVGIYTAINLYRPNLFLTFILNIGAIALFVFTPKHEINKRFGLLGVISFITGINLSDLINFYVHVNPSLVLSAFLLTAGVFISFTLFSLFNKQNSRTLMFIGSSLMSLTLGITVLSLFRLFGGASESLDNILMFAILASSVLFVIYDTQMIVYRIENNGDKDFIHHALVLFLDFVDLFRIILVTLAKKEKNNERRKRR